MSSLNWPPYASAPALRRNEATGEPYLSLKHHDDVILTPFRTTDVAELVKALNDEEVYKMLDGPPQPYTEELAKAWIKERQLETESGLADIQSKDGIPMQESGSTAVTGSCIATVIRSTQGDQPFIGSVSVQRIPAGDLARFMDPDGLLSEEERNQIGLENEKRPLGDKDIVWTMGYYLSRDYQGKGIMSDAAQTLLHDYAIPVMGVRKMIGTVQVRNIPSAKVYEKLGFVKRHNGQAQVESRKWKGQMMYVFDWKVDGGNAVTEGV